MYTCTILEVRPNARDQCFPSTDVTFDHRDPDDAVYVDPAKVDEILRTKYKVEENDATAIGAKATDAKAKSTLTAAAAALSVVVDGMDEAQVRVRY